MNVFIPKLPNTKMKNAKQKVVKYLNMGELNLLIFSIAYSFSRPNHSIIKKNTRGKRTVMALNPDGKTEVVNEESENIPEI